MDFVTDYLGCIAFVLFLVERELYFGIVAGTESFDQDVVIKIGELLLGTDCLLEIDRYILEIIS